jgi:hypothetical protein
VFYLKMMDTSKPSDVTQIAVEKDMMTEERSYDLNRSKAMKKKKKAAEMEEIVIEETRGGTKIQLNAGTFELLKSAVKNYFSDEESPYNYTFIPVVDKQGNQVEAKYKVCQDNCHLYTLNMYFTKSSCLVNGKQAAQFINTDLPNILTLIESELKENGMSFHSVNEETFVIQ